MRPRSRPPTPTLDEPLPPIAYRAEKNNDVCTIWIKRTQLLPKKRYCTQDLEKRPIYIRRFNKKRPTVQPEKNDYKNIWRYESSNTAVSLISKCENVIPEDNNTSPITSFNNNRDFSSLEEDLYLSDSDNETMESISEPSKINETNSTQDQVNSLHHKEIRNNTLQMPQSAVSTTKNSGEIEKTKNVFISKYSIQLAVTKQLTQ